MSRPILRLVVATLVVSNSSLGLAAPCGWRPVPTSTSHGNAFNSVREAEDLVRRIVDLSGLAPRFRVEAADVPNAEATIRGGQRMVLYNPDYIAYLTRATGSEWASISVLAHEIGHHLNGHTLDGRGSRPDIELEADTYSGYVLERMGASLEQAKEGMRVTGDPHGSATHPPLSERLDAIESGWRSACEADPNCGTAHPEPTRRPQPVPDPETGWPAPSWPTPRRPEPARPAPPRPARPAITDACTIAGQRVAVGPSPRCDGHRVPPRDPGRCIFDIVTERGRVCVERSGVVTVPDRWGRWRVIGQCRQCRP